MEVLVRGQIGDLDLEQVVVVAGDVVGVNNLGQPDHRSFEGDNVRASVPDEPHASEDPQTATDRCGIDQRLVTADYSGLFQSANPPQARRRRETDACSELVIADPAVLLERGQYRPVDVVHIGRILRTVGLYHTPYLTTCRYLLPKLPRLLALMTPTGHSPGWGVTQICQLEGLSMSGSSTIAIHADRDVYPSRAVARPIYQTAAFWAEDAEQFAQVAVDPRGHDFYTRYGNPNHAQVAAVVAELEHAEAAMVTASGMAALTTAVLGLVSAGDHVIGQQSTYGGTASVLLNLLPRLGITTTQVDQTEPGAFERAVTPRTRLILLESPSNPLLQITDLRSIAAMARTRGVLTLADNTFATPLNQRPIDLGIDLVWHSATKYLNGHSDVSAGVLAGPAEILNQIWDVAVLTGAVLGPFDAWLLLRGIRTLPMRMPRHDSNGQALAEALSEHPAVSRVHYPGLPSHPQHALAASQMRGFGGVLAVELAGGYEAADAFIGRLAHFHRSASLGGVESLAVHPAAMWRGMLSEQDIAASGVPLNLVRLAAGTEDTEDLVTDVLAAADAVAAATGSD